MFKYFLLILTTILLSGFKYPKMDVTFVQRANNLEIIISPILGDSSLIIKREYTINKFTTDINEEIFLKKSLAERTHIHAWYSSDTTFTEPILTVDEYFYSEQKLFEARSTKRDVILINKSFPIQDGINFNIGYFKNGNIAEIYLSKNDRISNGYEFDKDNKTFWTGEYKGELDTVYRIKKDGTEMLIVSGTRIGTWYQYNLNSNKIDSTKYD